MNQLNSLILEGNVCKEPEIKEINGEKNLATFSIAVNRILNAKENLGFIEENVLVMGELELSGRVRAVKGIHAACSTAYASGIQYALADLMKPTEPLVRKIPFRIPHQTASIEGICGGGPKYTEQMFKVCQYYDVKNVDLAELMCTSEVEVSNWKTGKRFPGWDKIMLFAYTVGLPLDIMILGKKA